MGKRRLAREFALQILFQLDITKEPTQEGIKLFWANRDFPAELRDFANQLVEGTMDNLTFIDQCITSYSTHWTLNRMPTVDRNILRFSVYEILFMPEIPDKVTINEALEISKEYGTDESPSFINGILDKIVKEKDSLLLSFQSLRS